MGLDIAVCLIEEELTTWTRDRYWLVAGYVGGGEWRAEETSSKVGTGML